MVDFVKIWIDQAEADRLQFNPLLEFKHSYNQAGDFNGGKAEWNSLIFHRRLDGRCFLTGSLHYAYNISQGNGKQNHSDFTASQLLEIIDLIKEVFELRIRESLLINLEFGVNISLPGKADQLVKGFYRCSKQKPFTFTEYPETGGVMADAKRSNHRIKIYDKGRQFGRGDNLLRIEIKATKAEFLRPLGLKTVGDLLNPDLYPLLLEKLLTTLDKCLFVDPDLKAGGLYRSGNNQELKKYLDSGFWHRVAGKDSPRNKYSREVWKFKRLRQKTGCQTYERILSLVAEKWCKLTESESVENDTQHTDGKGFEYKGSNCTTTEPRGLRVKSAPFRPCKFRQVDTLAAHPTFLNIRPP